MRALDFESSAGKSQVQPGQVVMENADLRGAESRGAQDRKSTPATLPTDADFLALADAWPTLPPALKSGIVAMVKAAGGGKA